jgi:hypothetical protein
MGDLESRNEMLDLERVRWDQLQRLLYEIPIDRFDEPTLNPDGWSVRDLLWHLARWNEVIAEQLELMNAGTFDERFDWNTEENNAVFMAEGRSVSVEDALSALAASRQKSIDSMRRLPDALPPRAGELFSESAYRHLDDHLLELTDFVEGRTTA